MTMILKVGKAKNVDGAVSDFSFAMTKAEVAAVSDVSVGDDGVTLTGRWEHHERILHVVGEVTLTLKARCDRCGEPVEQILRCDFVEDFTNVPEKADEEANAGEDGIHAFSGDEIDLFPYAERVIYLNEPMKILCKDDCKGLCPECGANRNENECSCKKSAVDPRLAVLADLLGDKE